MNLPIYICKCGRKMVLKRHESLRIGNDIWGFGGRVTFWYECPDRRIWNFCTRWRPIWPRWAKRSTPGTFRKRPRRTRCWAELRNNDELAKNRTGWRRCRPMTACDYLRVFGRPPRRPLRRDAARFLAERDLPPSRPPRRASSCLAARSALTEISGETGLESMARNSSFEVEKGSACQRVLRIKVGAACLATHHSAQLRELIAAILAVLGKTISLRGLDDTVRSSFQLGPRQRLARRTGWAVGSVAHGIRGSGPFRPPRRTEIIPGAVNRAPGEFYIFIHPGRDFLACQSKVGHVPDAHNPSARNRSPNLPTAFIHLRRNVQPGLFEVPLCWQSVDLKCHQRFLPAGAIFSALCMKPLSQTRLGLSSEKCTDDHEF